MESRLLGCDRNRGRLARLVIVAGVLLSAVLPQAAGATQTTTAITGPVGEVGLQLSSATGAGYSLTPSRTEPSVVCPPPAPGRAACLSVIDPKPVKTTFGYKARRAGPLYEGGGEQGGWAPKELREAYGISTTGGSEQTVAIVDAYDDPNVESDMNTYRLKYGIGLCTKENKCFKKVNQKGEEKAYPTDKYPHVGGQIEDWGLEISLDVEMVSAICPECKIMLVEANSDEDSNLFAAENEAASLDATEISNSWGGSEFPGETSYDSDLNHSEIPITASAGDDGFGVEYPAASQYVIAVGGTTLKKNAKSTRGWEESVWDGTGGGCSAYEPKPEWQHDSGCGKRTDNDVAAVANNETPVSVYDSYEYKEEGGWETGKLGWVLLGGTSVASPLVAGIEAHAVGTVKVMRGEAFYRRGLYDVTTGSNGRCGHTYLCEAGEGYDGPTGWGTPDGALSVLPSTEAVTGPATNVTATGAQLNGWVFTAKTPTTYYFEYGPTTAYGTDVPVPTGNLESASPWLWVSQATNRLHTLSGGTYHYRLVATNSKGTAYGADHVFATIPWAVQTTPNPSKASSGYFKGVSCTSSTACTGVTFYVEPESNLSQPGAEAWNGSEWKLETVPKPSGAHEAALAGVSCTASNACTAVGYYTASSEGKALSLAERWNGTEWSVQTVPNSANLFGVSCVSAAECIAVGSSGTSERWNGTEWIKLTGGGGQSISCTSSTFCMATGRYGGSLIAERWNGAEWSLETGVAVAGATSSRLNSVSCTSPTACTAVGAYSENYSEVFPLAERWNGTEWTIETTPNPAQHGGEEEGLSGVSCASATECVAVGGQISERWNGTEWALSPIAEPEQPREVWPGEGYALNHGISCVAFNVCTAVGKRIGSTEEWGEGLILESFATLAENRVTTGPFAETKEATSIGETGATLNGVVNPEGSATKYYFEYGTTKAYGSKTTETSAGSGTSDLEESKALTGLTGDTTYYYRIVATSSNGTVYGAPREFITTGKPVVETKPATLMTETGAYLNGVVNPRGFETKYYFEYGTTEAYGSKTAEVNVGSGVANLEETEKVSGLAASTTYDFRIVATNSRGTTYGANQVFSTKGKPTGETTEAKSITGTGATLTGLVNPRNTATEYHFEYGTTEAYGSTTTEMSAGSGGVNVEESSAITGLAIGKKYDFRIVAVNRFGTFYGSNKTFSTVGSAPTDETKAATGVNEKGAVLNGVVNPNGIVTKYYFEYGLKEAKEGKYEHKTTEISAGAGTSSVEVGIAIVGLEKGTTYHFRVVASNEYGTADGTDATFTTTSSPAWGISPTPNPTGEEQSRLEGTSCTSATACRAVGYYKNSSGARLALADVWNGEGWTEQATSKPSGATETELYGVSCSSATACTAVGSYLNSAGVAKPLAERWNGEAWSVQEPPMPTEAKEGGLFAVSCASSTACTAVGAFTNSAGAYRALAESWNGTSWSATEPPNPSGAKQDQLVGVSCTAANACTAVGEYENSAGTAWPAQAERWNGTSWSLQEPPSPTGAHETWPYSVSCASASACTLVGYYYVSGEKEMTLGESWNGTSWTLQSTPNPTGAAANKLLAVTCTSSTACTAVGGNWKGEAPGEELTLAERWNGTEWAIQSTPNPTAAPESRLLGVSCTSSTACTGVGYYYKSKGEANIVTLAEVYG
jgi:hypothetical protein